MRASDAENEGFLFPSCHGFHESSRFYDSPSFHERVNAFSHFFSRRMKKTSF
jgi:hypothetical protein